MAIWEEADFAASRYCCFSSPWKLVASRECSIEGARFASAYIRVHCILAAFIYTEPRGASFAFRSHLRFFCATIVIALHRGNFSLLTLFTDAIAQIIYIYALSERRIFYIKMIIHVSRRKDAGVKEKAARVPQMNNIRRVIYYHKERIPKQTSERQHDFRSDAKKKKKKKRTEIYWESIQINIYIVPLSLSRPVSGRSSKDQKLEWPEGRRGRRAANARHTAKLADSLLLCLP